MKLIQKAIMQGDGKPIVTRICDLFQSTSFSLKDYDEIRKKLGEKTTMEDIRAKNRGANQWAIERYILLLITLHISISYFPR
jgi:hypothetical protein